MGPGAVGSIASKCSFSFFFTLLSQLFRELRLSDVFKQLFKVSERIWGGFGRISDVFLNDFSRFVPKT